MIMRGKTPHALTRAGLLVLLGLGAVLLPLVPSWAQDPGGEEQGQDQGGQRQREAALKKAAEARKAFAVVKEKLKMGSLTLSEALDRADSDDAIGRLKVVTFLESLPGVGKVKARRIMSDVGIADNRRVKGLGEQQRQALRQQLG